MPRIGLPDREQVVRHPCPLPIAALALLVAAGADCTGSGVGGSGGSPVANAWVDPAPAVDKNPDPKIVEIDLEAGKATKAYLPGKTTSVLAYNGTVPGPLIDANVGDTLVVHFKNSLAMNTTVHWHGVRVPNAMDGTMAVQMPVGPGESFDYQFQLPDAGLFWFHPHVMEDVQIQQGLYGVIRVRGPNEPSADDERVVVLDDVLLDKDGGFPATIDSDTEMIGREGNVLLVNGEPLPTLGWRSGAALRLRLVNVANARFFNLALDGYTFHVIGTDGGFMPKPYDTDKLLIAPGERYDVMLLAHGKPGDEVTLMDQPYDRGHDTGKEPPMPLAKLRVTADAPLSGRSLPTAFPSIERLPGGAADTTITFDEKYVSGHPVFTVNGDAYPNVLPIDVMNGSVHVVDLVNNAEMDHPFHLHGFFFQVLARGGTVVPDDALADKDTLILPQKSTVRIVTRFDRPGSWMYHCHILEHAERGMMGEIDVAP
jgi:FtsP/CotA-like multicopper oxidase with cupredoxin domain